MKIFKWLTDRGGKIALSAAQAVGLSAVVGVAGVAAWQFLDTPTDNTAFNLGGQSNRGEVVYVAGASGGTYGENGEIQSAFMATPSKAIEMTEKQALAQKQAEEAAESFTIPVDDVPSSPALAGAYQMGGSEGLGMGGNFANEEILKNNPMAFAQQSIAGVTDAITRAQAQAQGAGQNGTAAAAGGQQAGAAPALASASRDWGSSAATRGLSGGGGTAFNSSFVVQDSQKGGGSAASAGTPEQAARVMQQFQEQLAASGQEGQRLRAQANFGVSQGLDPDWDATAAGFRNAREGKDLEFIRKRSADAAGNRNRAANEGARAFLASTKISGGLRVSGANVTTGQGQSSADFNGEYDSQLRAIQGWSTDSNMDAIQRQEDRNAMIKWMWTATAVALAAMIAIPLVKNITVLGVPVGFWLALGIAALATYACGKGFVEAAQYARRWGGSGMSTAIMAITPILTGGVWASFIWAKAFKNLYTKVGEKLGFTLKEGTATAPAVETVGQTGMDGLDTIDIVEEGTKIR